MVIRSRKSKKDKQHNGKRKRTKGQTETVHRKSKTSNMNPTKIWGELKRIFLECENTLVKHILERLIT